MPTLNWIACFVGRLRPAGPANDSTRLTQSSLTTAKAAVYDDLRFDRLQPRLRLEQERVGFGWLRAQLRSSL